MYVFQAGDIDMCKMDPVIKDSLDRPQDDPLALVTITDDPSKSNESSSIQTKMFSCGFCGIKFGRRPSLTKHISTQHVLKEELSCKNCNYRTTSTARMKKHSASHVKKEDIVISCTICEEKFSSKVELSQHFVSHEVIRNDDESFQGQIKDFNVSSLNKTKEFSCGQCGEEFSTKSSTQRHIATQHDVVKQELTCDKCDYRTTSTV
jgi:transcription elongation factor Elf1